MTTRTRMNSHSLSPGTSGAALILILLAILALSALVVLFFSLASVDRTNSSVYAQGLKAEELANGGLELVIEKLREEIVDPARSTPAASSPAGIGPTIYTPTAPGHILPDATVTVSGTAPSNLLKISSRSHPISLLTSGTTLASAASTATPSRNGRSIPTERWNKPELAVFDSGTGAPIPDWISFNRKGPVVNPALPDAADEASEGFVTGRVAFAVYDVGGLIDINVAGYPASVPGKDAGRKGNPAFAELDAINLPGQSITDLLAFRNASSGVDAPTFLSHVANQTAHQGFTRTLSGDNRFLSRQELIRFATRHGFRSQLPLLTIFSREKNAPSYAPSPSLPAATADPSLNGSLAAARHAASGRLLYERRFPLEKIALLKAIVAAPNDVPTQEALQNYFGLKYEASSGTFLYVGHEAGASLPLEEIPTLSEIGAESEHRLPDFFETLKATIQSGSLGQTAGDTAARARDFDPDIHVLQIGANILDQWDADSLPTTIAFAKSSVPIWGVEDLPYVNKVFYSGESMPPPTMGHGTQNRNAGQLGPTEDMLVNFTLGVELWNPHFRNLPTSGTPNPKIRVSIGPSSAETRVDIFPNPEGTTNVANVKTGTSKVVGGIARDLNIADQFTDRYEFNFESFCEPRQVRLTAANSATIVVKASESRELFVSAKLEILNEEGLYIELSVWDGSKYVPYQRTYSIRDGLYMRTDAPYAFATIKGTSSYVVSDPRTSRAGFWEAANFRIQPPPGALPGYQSSLFKNLLSPWSLRAGLGEDPPSAASAGVRTSDGGASASFLPLDAPVYLGLLWENTSAASRLLDRDGVARKGDGGFGGAASATAPSPTQPIKGLFGYAWSASNTNPSRPIILNRAFRSVAEMGHAFRDIPWRSLNFSTSDSADAGLLDVFEIQGSETTAGKLNPNTPHAEALASLIQRSLLEVPDAPSIDAANARSLAQSIVTHTTGTSENSGPLLDISRFVTEASESALTTSSLPQQVTQIKTRREAVARALAGSVQTRTWNVMIDLVAQTGRFAKSATSLDDFVVDAERRYWLHVAIDRYTGEIVEELLEVVNE